LECRKRPIRLGFTESIPDWCRIAKDRPGAKLCEAAERTGRHRNFPLEENTLREGIEKLSPVERQGSGLEARDEG
jgi:hypothetical protein